MQTCLDHAKECLGSQTPQDFVRQLAVASHALQKARPSRGVQQSKNSEARAEVDALLERLRLGLEPAEEA